VRDPVGRGIVAGHHPALAHRRGLPARRPQLHAEQVERGVKRGSASSVIKRQWAAAEIYPAARVLLPISSRQADLLQLFST
jgi:hypothetical protein